VSAFKQEPVTVRGWRRPKGGVIHLYSYCGTIGEVKSREMQPGVFAVDDPRKEVCGMCYTKKRREPRYPRDSAGRALTQ